MPGLCRFLAVSAACAVLASPVLAQGPSSLEEATQSPPAPQLTTPTPTQDAPADAAANAPANAASAAAPEVTAPAVTTGPTFGNATSGIRANAAHEDLTTAEAAHRAVTGGSGGGLNKGAIVLIVGGAAIAAGVLIGGTGGAALAIGGALVALYGIYLLLQ